MVDQLLGKKILITGGTRGLGRDVTLALAHDGADTITCYRKDVSAAEKLHQELKQMKGDHHVVCADVSNEQGVDYLAGECHDHFGKIDALVNNAGAISHVPIEELTLEEWRRILDTNLTAAYLTTQKMLPLFSSDASIVNVGSRVAERGIPLRSHYTAAKAGLQGLTKSLAKELGPRGIRVNVVAPGPIETDIPVPAERIEAYKKMIALGRLGQPEEVAAAVVFLASDAAGFVTGETINIDGGI